MNKKYYLIILMILVSTIGIANVSSEKNINVFGTVYLDGDPLESVNITVRSMDRGHEVFTVTDINGNYEIYINAIDHEDFKVFAEFDNELFEDEWFEVKGSKTTFEIDINLFSKGDNGNAITDTTNVIISFFSGLWDILLSLTLMDIIKFFILLLLLICILKLLFPKRGKSNKTESSDNDVFIFSNGRMKRI